MSSEQHPPAESPASAAAAPRRKWRLQFSLRTLLIVVTVACLLVGGYLVWSEPYRRESAAIAVMRRDKEIEIGLRPNNSLPAWLSRWLGVGESAVFISCDGSDKILRLVAECRCLLSLEVESKVVVDGNADRPNKEARPISEAGLVYIGRLVTLESLYLRRSEIGDRGLAELAELKNLTYLELAYTHVTDAGLEYLNGMEALTDLSLWHTDVTPAGVQSLKARMPNLRVFYSPRLEETK